MKRENIFIAAIGVPVAVLVVCSAVTLWNHRALVKPITGEGSSSVQVYEMPPLPSGVRMADELLGSQLKPGDILEVGPDGKLRIIGGTAVSTPHDRNDSTETGTAEVTSGGRSSGTLVSIPGTGAYAGEGGGNGGIVCSYVGPGKVVCP